MLGRRGGWEAGRRRRKSESTALKSGPAEGRKRDLSMVSPARRAESVGKLRSLHQAKRRVTSQGVFERRCSRSGSAFEWVVSPNGLPLPGNRHMENSCWGPLGSTWSRALLGHTPAHLVFPASWAGTWASRAVSKAHERCGHPRGE